AYSHDLDRRQIQTFVDREGDAVWIAEYLRYRVSGCSHDRAIELVFRQVNGAPPAAACSVDLAGYVHEDSDRNARRPPICLPAARIEVMDGPSAGLALQTDSQGRFVLHNVQATMLSVSKNGFFPGRFSYSAANTTIDIALRPSEPIVQRVWDE